MNFGIDYTNHTSNGGFLSGYVESSVEKPADGLNGECTIHYSGRYSKYEMIVPLVNGKRDGKAMIVNDGMPYLRLEYRRGSLTGVVERMNEFGAIELRGHLVNGVESGFFEEYDGNDNVVWRGYYRNGRRYSEVVKSRRGGRWYVERRVGSGEVLSIAEYDEGLHDKNGKCWEYENGKWVDEWVYENGVRGRCVREDRDGMMVAYDENGEKTKVRKMNEWDGMRMRERLDTVMKEKNNDSMMDYDIETGKEHGVWKKEEKCYAIKRSDEENRVVVADLKTHEMRVYDGDDWKENEQDGVDCIDLDVNGRRWEGGVKDGKPLGYGMVYDEEGIILGAIGDVRIDTEGLYMCDVDLSGGVLADLAFGRNRMSVEHLKDMAVELEGEK